jgi:tetratricopeptide (TPR) repeat protein
LSSPAPAVGTLEVALAHATRLLAAQPALAAEQAEEILRAVPGSAPARLILGRAQRALGNAAAAIAVLEPLAREQAGSALAQFELGNAYSLAGRLDESVVALTAATRIKPDWPDAWRVLADHLDAVDDTAGAETARAVFLTAAVHDPGLQAAAKALRSNELPQAEALLRAHLKEHETDIAALRMLAEVATRLRRFMDAQLILERCLELAPDFAPALHHYAVVLFRQAKADQAMPHVENLLARDPTNLGYLTLKAAVLAHLGDTADSVRVYEAVLQRCSGQARLWLSYGHALKTAGRSDDSIAAYRRAGNLLPTLGDAYWSLANMKTFRFDAAEVQAMRTALERADLAEEDRLHFEFSLGKALEDASAYAEAFSHYATGADIRRRLQPYSAEETASHVRRSRNVFTREFFASRDAAGAAEPDPIFIIGMPRSGSTLLEQILSSHPLVEGTMELPNVPAIARELADLRAGRGTQYPESIADLQAADLIALGRRYIAETRLHRKSGRPHFIDKMPNNFLHVGLIHLMLPNAKIIDARRHPLACCFSNFKQHFARGQNFSYSLDDVGRFYRDYVELMAHFDSVLPGRVHRVIYERVVDEPQIEVQRLLDYCGLPFDERCMRFYENDRSVRTASSEQVRQPIFRSGLDHWRNFEPWLDPLKAALGDVLVGYPEVPGFRGAE